MNETEKLLISISEKIKRLIAQNSSLKNELKIKSKKVEKLENLVQERNVEVEHLSEKNKILQISKAVRTEESAVETKKRINELVREIDKCIGLLNQ